MNTPSGPQRKWEKDGERAKITLSPRTSLVKSAKELGLNLTKTFEEALWAQLQYVSGASSTRIEEEIQGAEKRLLALRAAKSEAIRTELASEAASAKKADLESEVQKAIPFWAQRKNLSDRANLAWAESRAVKAGISPKEFITKLKEAADAV